MHAHGDGRVADDGDHEDRVAVGLSVLEARVDEVRHLTAARSDRLELDQQLQRSNFGGWALRVGVRSDGGRVSTFGNRCFGGSLPARGSSGWPKLEYEIKATRGS